jgi:GT2 family glycosyltransferase
VAVVSALVCTRNRPDSLLRTVRSLLNPSQAPLELFVVDQSEGRESQEALSEFESDLRLRYVRSHARGKGAALNQGLRLATSGVVVCTDDDCEVPPGWPIKMAEVMAAHQKAAVVFCNVKAPEHDRAAGYVPTYERCTDRVLHSIADAKRGFGLGAGMALRREAVLAFGGFDETFGPGARFSSGDDWDLSVRALLLGWQVYDTTEVSVIHHGFRTFAQGREHALRDWLAIGSLCAKPIRAGYFSAMSLALSLFFVDALWPPVADVLRLRRPSGLSRIVGFVRGFLEGVRTQVDRKTLLYRVDG